MIEQKIKFFPKLPRHISFWGREFTLRKRELSYLLYLPDGYAGGGPDREWPLLLFLHGSGERGRNPELVKRLGIPRMIATGTELPFIVVAPQCPLFCSWDGLVPAIAELLDDIAAHYPLDRHRIYLTGISMGGYGVWSLALQYPERFAALVPISGGLKDPDRVRLLTAIPIWVFHGAKDWVVSPGESQKPVEVLRKYGGNVRLTIYEDAEHDAWTRTYQNSDFWDWILKQHK